MILVHLHAAVFSDVFVFGAVISLFFVLELTWSIFWPDVFKQLNQG